MDLATQQKSASPVILIASVFAGFLPYFISRKTKTSENVARIASNLGLGIIFGCVFLQFLPDYLNTYKSGTFELDDSKYLKKDVDYYTAFMRDFLAGIIITMFLEQLMAWLTEPIFDQKPCQTGCCDDDFDEIDGHDKTKILKKPVDQSGLLTQSLEVLIDKKWQHQKTYIKIFRAVLFTFALCTQAIFQGNLGLHKTGLLEMYNETKTLEACNLKSKSEGKQIGIFTYMQASLLVQKVVFGLAIGFYFLRRPAVSKWTATPLILFWACATPLLGSLDLGLTRYGPFQWVTVAALGSLVYIIYGQVSELNDDYHASSNPSDEETKIMQKISLLTVGSMVAYALIIFDGHHQNLLKQLSDEVQNCSMFKVGSPAHVLVIKRKFSNYIQCIEGNYGSDKEILIDPHTCYKNHLASTSNFAVTNVTDICQSANTGDVLAATWKHFEIEPETVEKLPTWDKLSRANPGDGDSAKSCFNQLFTNQKVSKIFKDISAKCDQVNSDDDGAEGSDYQFR